MYRSLKDIKTAIASGKATCQSIVQDYIARIEKEKHLNAFLEVWGSEALERAKLIDEKLKNGKAGKLAGMVIALKDNICYKGHRVSASSKILEGFVSLYQRNGS